MQEAKFTWFPKLTATVAKVPEDQRGAILWALAQYGTYGVEPELQWPLDAIFESLREDIDNSKRAISSGGTGGRGNKKGASSSAKPPFEKSETPLCETENPPCKDEETAVSETGNGGLEDTEPKPSQTKPNQANTGQAKRARRFRAPALGEVRDFAHEYAAEKGLDPSGFDAEGFVDYYTSNGWRVGRNPMKDWKATVRDWVRKDCKPGGGDVYDQYDLQALRQGA